MRKPRCIFLFAMLACIASISAQDLSSLSKSQQKEYKATLKNLIKQGYSVYGSQRPIEEALFLHFEKLNEKESNTEAIGTASNVANKSLGHQKAVLNAQATYIENQQVSVSGNVSTSQSKDKDGEEKSLNATFQSDIQKQLKGELSESFCLIREEKEKAQNGKPLYTMMVFMVASEQ